MSNAPTTSSSSSASSSQPAQIPSPVPTVSGEGQYGENITYTNGLKPNPYQLLHLFNSASSTNSDNEQMETAIPTLISTIPEVSSLDLPQNPKSMRNDSPPLPIPAPNFPTTPFFILSPLPIPTSNLRSSQVSTLIPSEQIPCLPLTPEVFRRLKPQFHRKVEHIPTVGGEALSEVLEDKDKEQENRTPSNDNAPPMLSLRSPTPAPTLMTQLVDCVSALCADWSTISPAIAYSTYAIDASKLSLGIHLETALTNEGLAALRTEGLV
uniref:Uncharacterized protein n=1 Tax=Moniliophthora roreri TaxID=221103 RepID=A0A0W0FFY8_MONRR